MNTKIKTKSSTALGGQEQLSVATGPPPNDYKAQFYLSDNSSTVIDRIKVTFNIYRHRELIRLLNSNFKLVSHHRLPNNGGSDHTFIDTFKNRHGKTIRYIYFFADWAQWHSIHFLQPDFQVQKEIQSILTILKIEPILSQIEFAVDTYSDNPCYK